MFRIDCSSCMVQSKPICVFLISFVISQLYLFIFFFGGGGGELTLCFLVFDKE